MSLLRREGRTTWWDDGDGGAPSDCSLPTKKDGCARLAVRDAKTLGRSQYVAAPSQSASLNAPSRPQQSTSTTSTFYLIHSRPSRFTLSPLLLDVLTTFLASDSERFYDLSLAGPPLPQGSTFLLHELLIPPPDEVAAYIYHHGRSPHQVH